MNGFLNLLKPPNMSSAAVVAVIKRLTQERVGHAGTLDPEAAGVLPIMVGRATRLLDYFTLDSKEYIAEIAFCGATDTQDAQGQIIESGSRKPSAEEILAVLPRFTGCILQRPPAYSALKQNGVPLYTLARSGAAVEAKQRETVVHEIRLLDQTHADGFMLQVRCGSGTYIRTLCHDIGQALRCPAHMRFLLRTSAHGFDMDQAITLEQAVQATENGQLVSFLQPMDSVIGGLPRVDVPVDFEKSAINGAKLPVDFTKSAAKMVMGQKMRLYLHGELLGIAEKEAECVRFRVVLMDHTQNVGGND